MLAPAILSALRGINRAMIMIQQTLRRLLLAVAVMPSPAMAATIGGWTAEYTGYAHGFTVLKLAGSVVMTATGYSAHVSFHTAGMVAMVVHADNDTQVSGRFDGNRLFPAVFAGIGHLRGVERVTRLDYAGGNPVVQTLSPPVDKERTAVPLADTPGTIDTLSAVLDLIRHVGSDGHCDGVLTTFDGRRLATQTAHTVDEETLERTDRSIFAGPALRCDFEGRQLAGFVRDENEKDLRKPRHGTEWLADMLPGEPPVPVRLVFENDLLGKVTLFLTSISAAK